MELRRRTGGGEAGLGLPRLAPHCGYSRQHGNNVQKFIFIRMIVRLLLKERRSQVVLFVYLPGKLEEN